MSIKGQSLGPPIRSDLSDPFRSNSFKTLKTEEYQSKIYELSNQVKILRQKLIQLEHQKQIDGTQPPLMQRNAELQNYVALLKQDNDSLRKENLLLRDKLKSLEAIVSKKKNGFNNQNKDKLELASVKSIKSLQYSPRTGRTSELEGNINKNSMHLSSGNSVTTNLIRQLLAQCNEPQQGNIGKQKKPQKDQFYEFKNTQDCFQPFFSSLTKQLKLRVKRCLIKQKDLLYIDNNIQMGVISPYKISSRDPNNFTRLIIVLTNIGQYPLTKITLDYIYSNDISLNGKKMNLSKFKTLIEGQISNNQQVKEQLDISVNSIDFKCVKFTLSYQVGREKYSQLLILPISKSKLFRQMSFTSAPKINQKIQRVFEYQKKIISQFTKLKSFFPLAMESKQKNGNPSISWKVQFMGRCFWIESFQVEQKLAISVTYQNQRALAQKIIEEYMFLFQKI